MDKKSMVRFTKMQAFGNDYVYVDAIRQPLYNLSELSRFASNRHYGIGSDGMVFICPSDKADFRMRIFNPDGTEAEMCGNALRSVGKYVYDHRMTWKTKLLIETIGGIKPLWLTVRNGKVMNIRANIGKPILDTGKIPVITNRKEFIEQPVRVLDQVFNVTAVSWGNPHLVTFVEDVMCLDLLKYGTALENMTELFPHRTNVTFAQVMDKENIRIREWERGTGETLGCGTGCCTAVVAGALTGRNTRKVAVEQIGGTLMVEWDDSSDVMYMTGPSHTVFESEIDVSPILNRCNHSIATSRKQFCDVIGSTSLTLYQTAGHD